jgi:hypothetical protein
MDDKHGDRDSDVRNVRREVEEEELQDPVCRRAALEDAEHLARLPARV